MTTSDALYLTSDDLARMTKTLTTICENASYISQWASLDGPERSSLDAIRRDAHALLKSLKG